MHEDRLSELPLSLILHILSFLPISDVVSTTLLSKYWVNLWTTVPCISIPEVDEWYEDTKTERFRKFVNGALRRWDGTKIQKFSITTHDESFDDDAHAWTLFALKNKVEELEISAFPKYSIPHDLYSSSSIKRLSLWYCYFDFHGTPSWNQLKSLNLQILFNYYIEDLVNQIMLGSPNLEVFELDVMVEAHDNLNIMSTSLKRLKIYKSKFIEVAFFVITLSICCPNLKTLEVNGLFECLFTDISSLTTLDFDGPWMELVGVTLKHIFSATQNVEELALTYSCVEVFGELCKKYFLSPLPNVKYLILDMRGRGIESGDVIDLLGIFPNLEWVKIDAVVFRKRPNLNTVKYIEFETNISNSFMLQLKIVMITARGFDSSSFGFIEFLMKHAVILKKLVIRSGDITSSEQKMFSEKLMSMPRSSPTAEVIIKCN